jgi:hypothetical protein
LFCKKCSIKENHHALGFLAPKRYCFTCRISCEPKKIQSKSSSIYLKQEIMEKNISEESSVKSGSLYSLARKELAESQHTYTEEAKQGPIDDLDTNSLPTKEIVKSN